MKNFITINNQNKKCVHPMIYNDHCDYTFKIAEDNYEEWLFSGGEIEFNKKDINGYPEEGFWVSNLKEIEKSDLWFL